jgi:hypothetical protein
VYEIDRFVIERPGIVKVGCQDFYVMREVVSLSWNCDASEVNVMMHGSWISNQHKSIPINITSGNSAAISMTLDNRFQ